MAAKLAAACSIWIVLLAPLVICSVEPEVKENWKCRQMTGLLKRLRDVPYSQEVYAADFGFYSGLHVDDSHDLRQLGCTLAGLTTLPALSEALAVPYDIIYHYHRILDGLIDGGILMFGQEYLDYELKMSTRESVMHWVEATRYPRLPLRDVTEQDVVTYFEQLHDMSTEDDLYTLSMAGFPLYMHPQEMASIIFSSDSTTELGAKLNATDYDMYSVRLNFADSHSLKNQATDSYAYDILKTFMMTGIVPYPTPPVPSGVVEVPAQCQPVYDLLTDVLEMEHTKASAGLVPLRVSLDQIYGVKILPELYRLNVACAIAEAPDIESLAMELNVQVNVMHELMDTAGMGLQTLGGLEGMDEYVSLWSEVGDFCRLTGYPAYFPLSNINHEQLVTFLNTVVDPLRSQYGQAASLMNGLINAVPMDNEQIADVLLSANHPTEAYEQLQAELFTYGSHFLPAFMYIDRGVELVARGIHLLVDLGLVTG